MQTRRPFLVLSSVAGAMLLATTLAACGNVPSKSAAGTSSQQRASAGSASSKSTSSSSTSKAPATNAVVMTPNVQDGASAVKVDTVVSVRASAGTLSKVKLSYKGKDNQGQTKTIKVSGTVSPDGATWTANTGLDPAAKYKLVMEGKSSSDSSVVTTKSSFTTQKLSLNKQTYPSIFPSKGSTVGVGMPVILTFDLPVHNRKEFQKHLSVTSSDNQVGTWAWYGDKSVHFRPKTYWKPGTKVSVKANLNGVSAGNGIYGQDSTSTSFTIGKSVVTKINLRTKMAKVYINGKLARRIPISGGRPGWESRSGTKLIMGKLYTHRMTNQMIGAKEHYDLNVHYAMRVTNSGEFLHAAPWNAAKFGRVNGSHGCIGMSTANAHWLFNKVTYGDPVVTTGSHRGLERGNGWSDWNISYSQYKKSSAI